MASMRSSAALSGGTAVLGSGRAEAHGGSVSRRELVQLRAWSSGSTCCWPRRRGASAAGPGQPGNR